MSDIELTQKEQLLEEVNPERLAKLQKVQADQISRLYSGNLMTREVYIEEAYQESLDMALDSERREFIVTWNNLTSRSQVELYPYLKDLAKVWVDVLS